MKVLYQLKSYSAGKLFIVAGGEPKTVQFCQPLFEVLGQRTFIIADEPPKANLVKLSGNFLIAAVIETLGEAALVGKAGIDRARYLDILTNTLFGAPVYKKFPDGKTVLLTHLCKGQLATVLQLPVHAGVTADDAQPQNSTAVVDLVAQVN